MQIDLSMLNYIPLENLHAVAVCKPGELTTVEGVNFVRFAVDYTICKAVKPPCYDIMRIKDASIDPPLPTRRYLTASRGKVFHALISSNLTITRGSQP